MALTLASMLGITSVPVNIVPVPAALLGNMILTSAVVPGALDRTDIKVNSPHLVLEANSTPSQAPVYIAMQAAKSYAEVML